MIKINQKYFIESIPYEDVNSDQIRSTTSQFTIFECENGFEMNTGRLIANPMATSCSFTDENPYVSVIFQKNAGRIDGKLKPQDKKVHDYKNYYL